MDNRKLDIIIGLYDEPVIVDKSSDNGDEVARIYTTGDDDFDNSDRIPLGEELVKRWNAYPELVEAIKELDLRATQARIASSIGQPRLKDADFLRGEMERISQVARTLLQTLKA